MKKVTLALLALGLWNCDSSTSPLDADVELNTIEYAGTYTAFDKSGQLETRPLNAQEIRSWQHAEIHYNMDTLRLKGGSYVLVANDVLWGEDTSGIGIDRFRAFRGAYELGSDSLTLSLPADAAPFFGASQLKFRYSDDAILIDYCMETWRVESSLSSGGTGKAGKCGSPDLSIGDSTLRVEQQQVSIRFYHEN